MYSYIISNNICLIVKIVFFYFFVDMGSLVLDVHCCYDTDDLKLIGRVQINNITSLTPSKPIKGLNN